MPLASLMLRFVASATVLTLAACQGAPSPAPASTTTPDTTRADATPVAASTSLPTGEQVTLGPITDQTVIIDQVGYLPDYPKKGVVVTGQSEAGVFQLVDVQTSRVVFAAQLGDASSDTETGQRLRLADFSRYAEAGTYTLVVPGIGRSAEFRIDKEVFAQLSKDALDSYEQLAVLAPRTWQTATAKERQSNQVMDVTGGWPDAGDYGRYTPSAATALGTMLLVADLFPQQAEPDLLQVLKRELDWMLKMQRSDGAVYHKVTPLQFGGFDKNSDNVGGQLYVFEANTPDAAAFAAVLAEASRVFQPSDPTYSAVLRTASEKSWGYVSQQTKPVLPLELEGTGGYVYGSDASQRFWAAAELFKTTGDPSYGQYVSEYIAKHSPTVGAMEWTKMDTYGLISVAFNDAADPELRAKTTANLSQWAESTARLIASPINPWATSVSQFRWASNKTALNNALLLLLANRVSPNPPYVSAALDQLHFVLGRNALGKCFVTGYGENGVKNPHNRTMFSTGRLVPGVLVGGPNADGQDGVTPKAAGQRSYVDQLTAYASNENSVEYNAPLVFVTSVVAASQT